MDRIVKLVMALCLALSLLAACGGAPATPTQTAAPTEGETAAPTTPRLTGKEALQGKKIIFLGNSYTFFGQTVIHKGYMQLSQKERCNDEGFFYQLCKANGVDVEVTNFTFGSHNITDLIGYGPCKAERDCDGYEHQTFLSDPCFDYVSIQCYSERDYRGDFIKHLEPVMEFFRQYNPDVQFLLLVPQRAYEINYPWVKQIRKLAEAENVLVCDWGGMLNDISNGDVQVPGATLKHTRSSYVNNTDNHHENSLAGYLTSLMVYCAITGEPCEGQPYGFCDDPNAHESFGLEKHREKYYLTEADTNFVEIMRSEADMLGLQQLAQQYLDKYK